MNICVCVCITYYYDSEGELSAFRVRSPGLAFPHTLLQRPHLPRSCRRLPRPDFTGGSGLLQQRRGPPCPAGQSLSAPLHPAGPAGAPQCSPMLSHVPPMPTPLMSRVCDMRERCASQFLTPSVSSPSQRLACLTCPCTYRGRPCPWLPTPCRTRSGTAHCCSRWRTSTQVHPLSECPHSSSSFSFFFYRVGRIISTCNYSPQISTLLIQMFLFFGIRSSFHEERL